MIQNTANQTQLRHTTGDVSSTLSRITLFDAASVTNAVAFNKQAGYESSVGVSGALNSNSILSMAQGDLRWTKFADLSTLNETVQADFVLDRNRLTNLESTDTDHSNRITAVEEDVAHSVPYTSTDKSEAIVSHLGALSATGTLMADAPYLQGQDDQLLVVGGELCRPVGYVPANTWGSRQLATVGVVTDVISYNREAIDSKDQGVLDDAKAYADDLLTGFSVGSSIISGVQADGLTSATKSLQMVQTQSNPTGLLIMPDESRLFGDLVVEDGTNTTLSGLSYAARKNYVPTMRAVDDLVIATAAGYYTTG